MQATEYSVKMLRDMQAAMSDAMRLMHRLESMHEVVIEICMGRTELSVDCSTQTC